jgi:hypothetical protein
VTPVRFDHLYRMTDQLGLFEHALRTEPRPEHGYCLDDAARGLVVVCREPDPSPELRLLGMRYLDFTVAAIQPDGACHNRMDAGGAWTDTAGLGDWWGRALWGLGVAAAHAPTQEMRGCALRGFRTATARRSPYLRSMVFAALGAGELLLSIPADPSARLLLLDFLAEINREFEFDREAGGDSRSGWEWPWPRLTYGNASIAEALLLAGMALPDERAVADGLRLLEFLIRTETSGGHLSVTPVGGRGPAEAALPSGRRPAFDQQPIEVAAIADACARAFELTGETRWRDGVRLAWAWFLGDNDSATVMVDPSTGAGFDGLERHGRNLNQGAESTLAALSTAQHARRLEEF